MHTLHTHAHTRRSAPAKAIALFKNIVRAKEIFGVLIRNGFLEFLEQVGAPSMWLARFLPIHPSNLTQWQRVAATCEQLGPTFVKLAQIASTRDDLLPAALTAELCRLRDNVAPLPWEKMQTVLATELGTAPENIFSEITTTPVACGSLGQVYRARLSNSGEEVAIKIQRPGVRRAMRADLEILAWLAQRAHERFPELRAYNLPAILAEATNGLLSELDFTIEARNAAHFNTLNPFPEVFAPHHNEALTTPRLLVSEWVEGLPPDSPLIPTATAERLAAAGARSVFHQIFSNGFFHADPHTGNVLVTTATDSAKHERLCLLDWGLAGALTRRQRHLLADLLNAISRQDPERVIQALLASGSIRHRIDRERLENETALVLLRHRDLATSPSEFSRAMLDLMRLFARHEIPLASDYTLLAKAVLAIEETGRRLDPAFDLRKHAAAFLRRLRLEHWNPATLLKLGCWEAISNLAQLREVPASIARFIQKLEDGNASLIVEHAGLHEFRQTVETAVNRLVLAIIVAALLVGSSMLARGEQNLWDFPPSLGVVGYALAFFFTLYLIWDILRHGRHKNPDE